jgi:hypothetical protein
MKIYAMLLAVMVLVLLAEIVVFIVWLGGAFTESGGQG